MLKLYNETPDNRILYHGYEYVNEVVEKIDEIGQSGSFSTETLEVAKLAAWFHATGFLKNYTNQLNKSILLAEDFLNTQQYPSEKKSKVLSTINILKLGNTAETLEQQVFSDAKVATDTTEQFLKRNPLLKLERELMLNQSLRPSEWAQVQLQTLMSSHFFTDYAKKHYAPIVAQNVLEQKKVLEKAKRNELKRGEEEEVTLETFQGIEKGVPVRLIQTFFRSNFRVHINLSAIADNKANIMISVNAIIISVLISILSYRNITETNPLVLMPVVIFLVTGLTSLIFAVLSARPKVTSVNPEGTPVDIAKQNIIFFGNFINLKIDQYEEAMDAMFRESDLLYGNMSRDLYYLGKVLDKKYRYLTYSYNIFMIGFVATVLTFLVAFLS